MELTLLWIDLFFKDKLFGFGLFGFKNFDDVNRNLLSIYWNDGVLLIDLYHFGSACHGRRIYQRIR